MYMLKRIKHSRRPRDADQVTGHFVELSTSDGDSIALPTKAQVSALMAELGRKGGKIGGKRRLETMTARERREVAKKAAEARWKKE